MDNLAPHVDYIAVSVIVAAAFIYLICRCRKAFSKAEGDCCGGKCGSKKEGQ